MSNINDFLKLLETNNSETVKVYVPSLDCEVDCKPFTVPQQKSVIKAMLNGVKGSVALPKVFNNIVQENIDSSVIPLISDRNAVLVQLRIKSLGSVIYDDKSAKTELVYYKEKCPKIETSATIVDNGITINLSIPTIKKDNEYYNLLDEKTYDNAGDIVNDLYLYEVAKYISSIEFQGASAQPTARESITLVNKLPISLNDKILRFIKSVKDADNFVLTATNGSQIPLNAKFFNTIE